MKILKSALIIVILIGASPSAFAKKHYTKAEVLSPEISEMLIDADSSLKDTYTITLESAEVLVSHYSIGTKRQPREILLLWVKKPEGYEFAYKLESGIGESFNKPILFAASNFHFVNISTEPTGSGGFVVDQFLWFAPDGSVHPVEFQQASEVYEGLAKSDEVLLTGGEKEFFYQDGEMKFEFWLGREGDPHCCPSGGMVAGTYKLVGAPKYDSFTRRYKANFQILVDHITPLGVH